MAKLNTTTILDIVNKIAVGVSSSSNLRNYFEETFEWKPQLDLSDIFAETVPLAGDPTTADTNVTSNPTILQKFTQRQIDPIFGSNGEAYAMFSIIGDNSSTKFEDFIKPQKFGNGYALRLFENSSGSPGPEIYLTDGSYQFDYTTGILRFNDTNTPSSEGWTTSGGPLFLTIYQYIGAKANTTVSSSFTSSFTSTSAVSPVVFSGCVLTVTHNLGKKYVGSITVYDNNDEVIIPDTITAIDSTSLEINLCTFSPIAGTWNVSVSL